MIGASHDPGMTEVFLIVEQFGWPVFPCGPNKRPLTRNGFKDATRNCEQIGEWAARYPGCMWGVPTGKESGLFVLDVDVDASKGIDGREALDALITRIGPLPQTVEVVTPRGGRHLYFSQAGDVATRCSAGELGHGLDGRGDGGYVIVPPSCANGRGYEWEASSEPGETPFAPIPPALFELVRKRDPNRHAERGHDGLIAEGGRNATLTSVAGKLRRNGLSPKAIGAALQQINTERCTPPLPRDEVAAIAHSVGRYEPSSVINWPDLTPLPAELPPVAPFAFDLLPEALRPWIADVAERVQCPPEFPGVAAMIALGSVLGRRVAALPKRHDSWREYPNLWGAIVGRPGVLKSPALREALRPLRELERDAAAVHETVLEEWKVRRATAAVERRAAEQNALKAAKKGAKFDAAAFADDEDEPTPPLRRFIINNSSIEALGEVLLGNPSGTLLYQDELVGLLRLLEREGNEAARAFYLAGWSGGEPYTFDRIGRGLNRRVDAVCLALLGSIQPAVVADILREAVLAHGGDGLLARFSMLVWPDVGGEWRNVDRLPDSRAYVGATGVFRRCEALTAETIGAEVDELGAGLRFDDAAQVGFESWREAFERSQRTTDDPPALVAHRNKYRKLVPAIALIGHLADEPAGGPIGEGSLLRALAWLNYLDSHARRAYSSVMRADADGARELVKRIRRRELPAQFRLRDVYRNGWARLSDVELARRAVRMLVDFDHLIESVQGPGAAGGRPTNTYVVNPKVYG